jgi:signal transduction histidine kinase
MTRIRLTLLSGGLFLFTGAALLTCTYLLVQWSTAIRNTSLKTALKSLPGSPHKEVAPASATTASVQHAVDLHHLLIDSEVALGLLAVLAVLLGWFVAGRMLRPLRIITATARRISAGNLHERLSLNGPNDEIKELGDTFDELLGRLQRSWDTQRQFISNVSHELRSPLTRLRLQAELMATDGEATVATLQAGYAAVIAAAQRQEELIAALLSLARGQHGLAYKDAVDLAPIARAVLRAESQQAEQRTLHINTEIEPAVVSGDPGLLEQLIRNLIDNAINHNTSGGEVHFATTTNDGNAVVSVSNDGPLIPPTQLDRLFRPFERLEPGRRHHKNGHGLGLSIVQAIATAHGAIITPCCRPEGGLCVEITFPPIMDLEHDSMRAEAASWRAPEGHRAYDLVLVSEAGGTPSGTCSRE